jgi:hypothetical protein
MIACDGGGDELFLTGTATLGNVSEEIRTT